VLPQFSLAQLGLALLTLALMLVAELSQAIKVLAGLFGFWLACDLAMVPCPNFFFFLNLIYCLLR
jgi:hypothetical protein